MSRKQRDHIVAKTMFRDLVTLAKERNPKLMGENPQNWKVEFAYIQGYLACASNAEKIAQKAHKNILATNASTQEGHDRLALAMDALERLMQDIDRRTPVPYLMDQLKGDRK